MRFTTRDQANESLRGQNHRIYAEGMAAMRSLVDSLTVDELAATNTCCPAWSNQDVVAHHIHFTGADDVPEAIGLALRETDQDAYDATRAERDAWTGRGVEGLSGRTVPELWDQWDAALVKRGDGHRPAIDLTMHLYDIEESLDRIDTSRTHLSDDALLAYATWFLSYKLETARQPLTLRSTDSDLEIAFFGDAPVVSGTSYDLLRCVGGRRTRAQADVLLDWDASSERARSLLSVYTWPSSEEAAP